MGVECLIIEETVYSIWEEKNNYALAIILKHLLQLATYYVIISITQESKNKVN